MVRLQVLKQCNANVFLNSPGDRRKRLRAQEENAFRLSIDVVNVTASLKEADLFICHGAMSNLVQAACTSTPVLTLPMNLEQLRNGLNYQKLGAGACLQKIESVAAGVGVINALLANDSCVTAAAELASQANDYEQENAIEKVAERCLALLS